MCVHVHKHVDLEGYLIQIYLYRKNYSTALLQIPSLALYLGNNTAACKLTIFPQYNYDKVFSMTITIRFFHGDCYNLPDSQMHF